MTTTRRPTAREFTLMIAPLLLPALWWAFAYAPRFFRPATADHSIKVRRLGRTGQGADGLAFSPDSKSLAIVDRQNRVLIWNFEKKGFKSHFTSYSAWVDCTIWAKEDSIALGLDHSVTVQGVPDGQTKQAIYDRFKIPIYREPNGRLITVGSGGQSTISAHATLAAFGDVHGSIGVWNLSNGKPLFARRDALRQTCGLALSPNDSILAVASTVIMNDKYRANPHKFSVLPGAEIALRDARTGKLLQTMRWEDCGIFPTVDFCGNVGAIGLGFSPDGRYLATKTHATLKMWDTVTGSNVWSAQDDKADPWFSANVLAFTPDGAAVAASWGGSVYFWKTQSGKLIAKFREKGNIQAIAISPDSKILAAGYEADTAPIGTLENIVKTWSIDGVL